MAAIRIETRSVPPQIPGGLRGTLSAGYDTNLEAQEYSGTLFGSSERVAYWGHGVWRTGTDYETGSGDVIPADFDSWEARGQLGYRTGDASWLSFDMGYQKQGPIDYPGRLLSAKSFKTNNLAAEWELARAQGLLRNIDLLVYLNSVDHQMDNTDKPTRMAMEGRVPPFALDVLVDSHIDVTGGRAAIELVSEGGWDVEIGGDAYSAKRDADRFIDALDPNQMTPPLFPFHDRMWPDATITDVGLWTRADRPLANRLSLSAAVRLDLVSADAKDVSDTFLDYAGATRADVDASETNFNAAATLSANLGSNWSLSTGAGSVVRTADASERYGDRIPGTRAQLTTEFLGNPHLDPERSTQGDIWLEGRFPQPEPGRQRLRPPGQRLHHHRSEGPGGGTLPAPTDGLARQHERRPVCERRGRLLGGGGIRRLPLERTVLDNRGRRVSAGRRHGAGRAGLRGRPGAGSPPAPLRRVGGRILPREPGDRSREAGPPGCEPGRGHPDPRIRDGRSTGRISALCRSASPCRGKQRARQAVLRPPEREEPFLPDADCRAGPRLLHPPDLFLLDGSTPVALT